MKTWCLNKLKESIEKNFEEILEQIDFASKAIRQCKKPTARN